MLISSTISSALIADSLNVGAIFHDPQLFDNPDNFDPERYLKTEFGTKLEEQGQDFRDTCVFGSGRVCSFAIMIILIDWLVIAALVHVSWNARSSADYG